MFRAIESLETRQLLCAVPHPAGFEPARLTPGMDKFAEGMSVTVQQLTHPSAAASNASNASNASRSAQPESPTYTPDGGTPNLAVLDTFMCDVNGNEVATPAVGSYAYMQVEYSTVNIPSGETYTVRMTVGGQNIDYTLNWGAGGSGTQYWVLRLGVWMITPGFKGASATLDVHNDIIESNGADNTGICNFNPATFGPKFIIPLEHSAWTDWTMVNYVDVNLAPGAPGDYNGGTWTYDGHNGWDFTAANWRMPDAGWDIYAAASGTVIEADDGHYDRNSVAPYPPSNYVTIDHGNGFTTTYYHLRLNTVAVEVGDTVIKGQKIGEMGSSGSSTNPHLHWGVYYHGMQVEPAVNYLSYFNSSMSYANAHDAVLDAGITNSDPAGQMYDGPTTIDNFNAGDTVWFWNVLGGVGVGDSVQARWYRPGNVLHTTSNWTSAGEQYLYWNATLGLPGNAQAGTWRAELWLNGALASSRSFTVQSAARPAEARMTETDGTYLIDNRSTPFDLGSVLQGTTSGLPTFSFRVRNDGESNLLTSDLSVPSGFTVTNGLASTIAPGSFDTVTLRMDADYDGTRGGWVTFETNDADFDEGFMRFRIAGKVNKLSTVSGNHLINDTIYIKRNGSDSRIWVNTSNANPPTYELPASELADISFNTGNGDDTLTVDFSAGDPLGGDITFMGGGNSDTLTVIGDGAATTYLAGPAGLSIIGGDLIALSGLEDMVVNAGDGDDVFTLNFYGLGDDLDAIGYDVDFNGQGGFDSVNVNDTSDVGARTYDVHYGTVARTGWARTVGYYGNEALTLNANHSDNTINLNNGLLATSADLTINANGGWDTINVGGTSVSQLDGAVVVNGGAGLDFVRIHDQATITAEAWSITHNTATRAGFGGLTYGTIEALTLDAQDVGSTVTVIGTDGNTPLAINANGGTDTINILGHYIGTEVLVSSGDGEDVLNVNTDNSGVARVRLNDSETLGQITIGNGGGVVMSANGSRVLRATGLNLTGNAFIDVADNDMIVDYSGASPIAQVQALLSGGYAGGAWTGAGIRSSAAAAATNAALGYAEATDLFGVFPATFSGQQIDNTAVCVKYTSYGDANLDGNVNLQDFNRLAGNFGTGGKRWSHGDFNFDGNVNLQDFNRLASSFGQGGFGPGAFELTEDELLGGAMDRIAGI